MNLARKWTLSRKYLRRLAAFSLVSLWLAPSSWTQAQQQPEAPPPAASTAPPAANAPAAPESTDAATAPAAADSAAAAPSDGTATPDAPGAPAATPVKGKAKAKKKEKPPKMIPVTVEHGVLTVDGWAGKADLNFLIPDYKCFYVWAPGVGTVIISYTLFPGSKFQPDVFDGGTLTVVADGHKIQLTSERHLMLGKKPVGAYVALDPEGVSPSSSPYPQIGYGTTFKAPYAWPGSLADTHRNPNAPPLPTPLQPSIQTATMCETKKDGTKTNCHTVEVTMPPDRKS